MNNTNNESGAVRIQAGDLRRLDHLRDINLTTDTMDFQKLAGEYKSELLWLKGKGKLGGQNKVPQLWNDRTHIDELLKMNQG